MDIEDPIRFRIDKLEQEQKEVKDKLIKLDNYLLTQDDHFTKIKLLKVQRGIMASYIDILDARIDNLYIEKRENDS